MAATTPPAAQELNADTLGWWWNLFPPLAAMHLALRATDPVAQLRAMKYSAPWTFATLLLAMALTMLVVLAGEYAPFVDPLTGLWDFKFKSLVEPTVDWGVLVPCGLIALAAAVIVQFVAWAMGRALTAAPPGHRPEGTPLASYSALAATIFCLLVLVSIHVLGWVSSLLKLHVFVIGWISLMPFFATPFAALGLYRVYRRTPFAKKAGLKAAALISCGAIFACTTGGLLIMERLSAASTEQGRAVNGARALPTAAVVQSCALSDPNIVCAITLFPAQWQDYELIGDWELGTVDSKGGKVVRRPMRWRPAQAADRVLALVPLEAGKDVTVEVSVPSAVACGEQGIAISNDDRFFFMRGRVRGQLRTSGMELRLRIDNAPEGLADLVKPQCALRGATTAP